MGKPVPGIGADAFARLNAYDWPGTFVSSRTCWSARSSSVREMWCSTSISMRSAAQSGCISRRPVLTLEEMERQHIVRALERTNGVLAGPQGAARLLGMSRSTVWSRMRKLGIQSPQE